MGRQISCEAAENEHQDDANFHEAILRQQEICADDTTEENELHEVPETLWPPGFASRVVENGFAGEDDVSLRSVRNAK